ncbi:MAG TPA: phosphotransferase family protein [Acidimicrobiales bacterium]|nr:phosphotransferase family protein [Acidimicrobiales bacterium]
MARGRRDDGQLRSGLVAWWAERHPERAGVEVDELQRPSAGRSNETVLATLEWSEGSAPIVVRMPTLVPSFPEYDLLAQSALQAALVAAGLPAPRPLAVEEDERWLGTPFFVMARIGGRPVGDVPALDPWLCGIDESVQRRIHTGFLSLLARVNRIDWRQAGLDRSLPGSTGGLASELVRWHDYVQWAANGRPTTGLVDLGRWCGEHLPRSSPPLSLCWGDARVGNVLFDETGNVAGALDWELASIGPAEMDIAWYLAMDELTTTIVEKTVPGFLDRSDALRFYETQLGRDLEDLDWHEVFAVYRAAAIADRQHRNAVGAGARPGGVTEHDLLLAHGEVLIERSTQRSDR